MRITFLVPSLFALVVGAFAGHSLAEDAQPAKPPVPKATPKFERLQLVFLRRSPRALDLTREQRTALGPQHLAHLKSMAKAGHLVLAGPFGEKDDRDLRGLCVYRTKTREEARKLASGDPAVKAGLFEAQAATWYVEEGYVAFPKAVQPKAEPKKDAPKGR